MSTFPEGRLSSVTDASQDELQALQLKRLKWTLDHAYNNVPMYTKKFDDAGVHPSDLQDLSDLSKFPYTTKQDLRDNYPYGTFAVPMEQVVRIHASSGTTGKPTVVGYTKGDIDRWADVVARSIWAAGGSAKDIVHVAYGYGLFTGGLGAHYGAEKLGCTVIPMSGGQTEKQVQLIQDFKPDIIMVTPSYCLNIADEFERQGIDPRTSSLRVGIFGAEPWTNAMRTEIEERMGMDAVDIYGLSEIMGPGVAQEFVSTKDGPTIWEDCFYPEIVDRELLMPIDDGEEGELVFTSLVKEAMPVIRYRTRDLTKLLPGSESVMRRMEKITGRSDDMMIIRGVNVFPTQIEEQILKIDDLSPHYQIEISREGNLDSLTVNVEVRGNDVNDGVRDEAARILQHQVKTIIGVSAEVNVRGVGEVVRSLGKAQRVVDLRQRS
ncbi:phenylacetate--CoA ligase PaaK [Leucothrix pacifica]|uniref:Phenylacetate-coenzyme A ligase n=1 Tax=Leucothrix pacifica TaxID=1247513 RepID=A0A317CGJ1_9GAMM|nr:phenylacetate--CoA ligase PaaK [Leucothrix pacifica]PWQ97636.1 phenylacetate--CoA ligase [Leucothrix pacifica]